MNLIDFARLQERTVRQRAAKLRRYWELKPDLDVEAAAWRQLFLPELRGVGLNEFLGEVLVPGSFSNHLGET